MPTISYALAIPLIAGGLVARYLVVNVALPIFWSPVANIPGPSAPGFWGSNLYGLFNSKISWKLHEEFMQKFGRTFRVFGVAKFDQRLLTLDPVAIGYILRKTSIYQRPWPTKAFISSIIGDSLFSSEGLKHKCQRRIADHAFGERNLQSFLPTIFARASQMTEKWISIVEKSEDGQAKFDVAEWVVRLGLDIIGEVSLGVEINSLREKNNLLHETYTELFNVLLKRQHPLLTFFGIQVPRLQPYIPTEVFATLTRCKAIVHDFGMKLIQEKRRILDSAEKCPHRDFLTLFLKANTHPDVPYEQRMSDKELLDIVNTMLSAGSETTALAILWTLHYLSLHPEVQDRLQEELLTVPTYSPSQVCGEEEMVELYKAIDSLPWLDAIIKETLRLSPSVHSSIRVAMVDDEIPLVKPMVMRDGTTSSTLKVKRGQWIHLPYEACNVDREIWGDDAWEFKPERWNCLPEAVSQLPGAYHHLMSFGAGPRGCIGMKFAHMEMKVVLHQIVSCLSFRAVENLSIIKGTSTFSKPYVEADWRCGRSSSLPLLVSRYLPGEAACT